MPSSGRLVCTTKNENKRMHPYMYIIVWCIMHVNTMGIGNFYTLQTPIITLPKSLEGPLKWNNASMSLHIELLYMLTHPRMTLFWKHFTLIDQFFSHQNIKIEPNSNHWKIFPNCRIKSKISILRLGKHSGVNISKAKIHY